MPHQTSPQQFSIGPWRIDSAARTISGSQGSQNLQPRLMAVLVALAKAYPDYIDRSQLVATVWKVEHVSDQAVNNAIGKLRNILGDDSGAPRFIQTERLGGYRLMVEPVWQKQAGSLNPRQWVRYWPLALLAGLAIGFLALRSTRPSGFDEILQFLQENPGRWEVEVAEPDEGQPFDQR